MDKFSIKIKNYKCFDEAGFDEIKRVNLIIGRNNIGKSSLLDLIEIATRGHYKIENSSWRNEKKPEIIFKSIITEEAVKEAYSTHTVDLSGKGLNVYPRNNYLMNLVGRDVYWTFDGNSKNSPRRFISCNDVDVMHRLKSNQAFTKIITNKMPIPFQNKIFRRVSAERDIFLEKNDGTSIVIQPNGAGITNTIQNFINHIDFPSHLVEKEILAALNNIFSPDTFFTDLVCQINNGNEWEIFLEEDNKGRIALSKSGSGLKTVLSVLVSIILVPELQEKPLKDYIFGFEELENSIHPALLRRLNDYIYKSALENDFIYFLTTHSSVLIDQFSKQADAQIIHVTQEKDNIQCKTVTTYIENNGILDDLDVRASDLLQANGVIWVEGPSDRVYLNKWIQLWSDGRFKESTHYQIIFYGGRLLSHLSAEEPDSVSDCISILNANRNAIIIIDSDKKSEEGDINSTKKRIRKEFEKMNSFCWITKGREIENYISPQVVNEYWDVENFEIKSIYDSFFETIDKFKKGEGKKCSMKKYLLAENLIKFMTKENMKEILDLNERMEEVCKRITDWNSQGRL